MSTQAGPGRRYDLEERLIDFAVLVMDVVESLPNTRVGNHVAGQFLRSGTAPAPNYGEAEAAESRNDFIHKMKVALKELQETRIWLLMVQRKRLTPAGDKLAAALAECGELAAIFAASVKTAQRNRDG